MISLIDAKCYWKNLTVQSLVLSAWHISRSVQSVKCCPPPNTEARSQIWVQRLTTSHWSLATVQTPIVRCFVQPRPIVVMQPNCDLSIKLLFSILSFADSAASSPTGPKKAFLMEIAHHGVPKLTTSGPILNKSLEGGEQWKPESNILMSFPLGIHLKV